MTVVKFLSSVSMLAFALLLSGCSAVTKTPDNFDTVTFDSDAAGAQKLMCVEENIGLTRHDRSYLEGFCPEIKGQLELVCFRFVRNTKDWRKACPGIDTPDKLECISVVQNGPGYALLESLQKCKTVSNRKQILCMSKKVSKSGVPLQPETVQECIDQNL